MAVLVDATTEQFTATNGLPGNVYTWCSWVWTNDIGVAHRTLFWLWVTGDVFSGVQFRDNGDLQGIDGATYAFSGINPLSALANTWYQVALVVNGANATFYRSAAGSALVSGSVSDFSPPASPSTWYIGDNPYDEHLNGRIAATKVWSVALTAAEVANELTQYVPKRTANLIRSHPWVRTETTDYSGAGNTLTGGAGTTTVDGPPIPWARLVARMIAPTGAPTYPVVDPAFVIRESTVRSDHVLRGLPAGAAVSVQGTSAAGFAGQTTVTKVAIARGVCSLGAASSGTARKVVSVVGGSTVGLVSTGTAQKVMSVSGQGVLGLATRSTPKKVAPVSGAVAVGLVSVDTITKIAIGRGSSAIGPSSSNTIQKTGTGKGTSSVGLFSTGAAQKIVAVSGLSEIGLASVGAARKIVSVSGLSASGLVSRTTPKKVATGSGLLTVGLISTGSARKVATARGIAIVGLSEFYSGNVVRLVTGCISLLGLTGRGIVEKTGRVTGSTTIGVIGRGTASRTVIVVGQVYMGWAELLRLARS